MNLFGTNTTEDKMRDHHAGEKAIIKLGLASFVYTFT
jgi:hypothetical protein